MGRPVGMGEKRTAGTIGALLGAIPGVILAISQACAAQQAHDAEFELLDNYRDYIQDVERWKEEHCDVE